MTQPTFNVDMDAALQASRDGKDLSGKDGILTPLTKQLTEVAMQAELEEHLAMEEAPNRKNSSSAKATKTTAGNFELQTPRDRAGTFEPQLVKKNQTQRGKKEGVVTAYQAGGYSMKAIAGFFGVHYATVSRAVKLPR